MDIDVQINPKLFCPLVWHLLPALRDPRIRFIYVEGGSSASKTFSICQGLLWDQWQHEYASLAFRRFHVHIKDTVYSSGKAALASLGINRWWTAQEDLLKSNVSLARMSFKGLDSEENIKGIELFDVVYNNEWNQFTEGMFDQERKRLRGRPNQKFICDWNPVSAKLWLYENRIDKDEWIDLPLTAGAGCPSKYSALDTGYAFKRINKKGNSLWIKVTYRDNFWIVGHPSGTGGFVDQATLDDFEQDRLYKSNFYRVYGNGERGVMRTGGEFWSKFDDSRDVQPLAYDKKSVVHVSVDNNRKPYVTLSIWQVDEADKELKQIDEIPVKEPNNSATKAAAVFVDWLIRYDYSDVVMVYGDASAKAKTTVDDDNASFFDKFFAELGRTYPTIDRVDKSNPPVGISAEFVNEIYENGFDGWSITIGDNCRVSIDDYNSVKMDKNGGMIKTKFKDEVSGDTYEINGHFSDAKRYFVVKVLENEFHDFKQKRSKLYGYSVS